MKDRLQPRKIKCIRVENARIEGHSLGWARDPASGGVREAVFGAQNAGGQPEKGSILRRKSMYLTKNGVSSCIRNRVQL
jgi:hypothetical protein